MNGVATEINYRRPQGRRWSIQRCFVVLGAPAHIVYRSSRDTGRKDFIANERYKPHGARWRFYNEYTALELRKWADDLFRESMMKYHPDKNKPRMVSFYTKKCQEMSEAYERAKKILKWHGV